MNTVLQRLNIDAMQPLPAFFACGQQRPGDFVWRAGRRITAEATDGQRLLKLSAPANRRRRLCSNAW
jgi:hypothetical protein